jgi:hypothetical protein
MARCEWNPHTKSLAQRRWAGDRYVYSGCANEATLSVGADGKYHLCESCAALPEFRRYRRRVPLKRRER